MPGRFTAAAVRSVHEAVAMAERRDDPRIGTEHLLLGVAGSEPIGPGLLGIDQMGLVAILEEFDSSALAEVGLETARIDASGGTEWFRPRRHRPFTRAAKDTLNDALEEAKLLRHRHLGPEHILLALSRRPSHDLARRILLAAGLESGLLRSHILSELRRPA